MGDAARGQGDKMKKAERMGGSSEVTLALTAALMLRPLHAVRAREWLLLPPTAQEEAERKDEQQQKRRDPREAPQQGRQRGRALPSQELTELCRRMQQQYLWALVALLARPGAVDPVRLPRWLLPDSPSPPALARRRAQR